MKTVFHKRFGEGQVVTEDEKTIVIEFEMGEKKLLKGAGLVLFNSEEEMEDAINNEEQPEIVKANHSAYYEVYDMQRERERKNLPSSMRR